MINLTATFTTKDGAADDFEQTIAAVRPQMLADPGCLRYDLQRVSGRPGVYVLLEAYSDGDALKRHAQSEGFVALSAKFPELIEGEPDIVILKPVGDQTV